MTETKDTSLQTAVIAERRRALEEIRRDRPSDAAKIRDARVTLRRAQAAIRRAASAS